MSQSDSFISEVTDEVRRDRLFALMRRYGWLGIVAVVAIVGGSAWVEWRKYAAQGTAEAFGDQLLAGLNADDATTALQAVKGQGAQTGLAKLAEASAAVAAGKSEIAVAALKAAANDASLPQSLRDVALLKAVIVAGDTMPAAERDAALTKLAAPGAPMRPLAMEQQALALLASGDKAGAIAKANEISAEAGLTPDLQQRLSELVLALGGEPPVNAVTMAQ